MCLVIPLLFLSFSLKGKIERPAAFAKDPKKTISFKHQSIIFFSGVLILILVPVFKTTTHLPPFMGILIGLGILWILTEMMHRDKEEELKHHYSVVHALRKVDTPSILFFLGYY
jgi:Na+/H+ antiporter NhaD/arsenite permease-like protein